jgi:hypothetical protein
MVVSTNRICIYGQLKALTHMERHKLETEPTHEFQNNFADEVYQGGSTTCTAGHNSAIYVGVEVLHRRL